MLISSTQFGERIIRLMAEMPSIELVGVITSQRHFLISYSPDGVTNVLHADLEGVAKAFGIPCYTMLSKMSENQLVDFTKMTHPDWILVAGWYHMVPRVLRDIAPAYGMHASLLPDYSGGAPLVWAMINGESRTGITLFEMNDGVDSGPVVAQMSVPIFDTDDIAALYSRVENAGLNLLAKFAPKIGSPGLVLMPQNESQRRVMPQRRPEDGEIDWELSTSTIARFIRAQTRPYPGAFTFVGGRKVHIWRSQPVATDLQHEVFAPGTLFFASNSALISTKDGALQLTEISIGTQSFLETEVHQSLKGLSQISPQSFDC